MINPKFKPSNFCANCCSDDVDNHHHHHVSISSWLKSELPEIKVRCSGIFSGKFGKNRHHRGGGGGGGNAVEFRYDPLSYALNFEDDHTRFDELPPRNFSARLPPSPPSAANKNAAGAGGVVVVSAQIAAYS